MQDCSALSIFCPSRTKKRIKRRSKRKNTIHATITTIAACVAVTFCYTTTTQAFSSLMENPLLSSTHGLPLHLSHARIGSYPNGLFMELSVGRRPWRTSASAPRSSHYNGYDSLHRSSLAVAKTMTVTEGDIHIRGQERRQRPNIRSGNTAAAVKAMELDVDRKDLYSLTSSYGLDYSDGIRLLEEIQQPKEGSRASNIKQDGKDEINIQSESSSNTLSSSYKYNSQGEKTGRSSTMPGFINDKTSRRYRSFRDGLLIAKHSNNQETANRIHKILNSEKEVLKRKKANSDAMYFSSASVPDSLIAFADEIHKVSRISPKEEIELGTKTQEAIQIQKVRDELKVKLRRNPTNSEWCAAAGKKNMEELEAALKEGFVAKERLVTSNLRMVQRVVNLYIRNGLGSQYNAGDLMQEGVIALIRAAEKFEPSRGFRFSTYAMYWIRAAVKRSQIIQSRVISVPQRLHETHKKITKTEYELKKELGRKPKKSELADAVGISEMQLDRCLSAIAQQCLSLDAELENTVNPNKSNSNKDTLYNILAAKYDNVEFKQLKSDLLKEDLIHSLRKYLSPREVDLLLLRYGLMDEKTLHFGFSGPLTIAEVSRLVGLKPDKVRRIINKSLRQLRHLIAHEWEDFEKEL